MSPDLLSTNKNAHQSPMRRVRMTVHMCLLTLALLASSHTHARAPTSAPPPPSLTIDLAQTHVDITTGFTGAQLVLFGVQDSAGDIAVVITGPRRAMVVRRKAQMFGLWINRQSVTFSSVPSYYDYALSRGTQTPPAIGLNALKFDPEEDKDPDVIARFQEALIRNKQILGQFPMEPRPVTYLNEKFFRVSFDLPANVPTGDYTIETFLMREGLVLQSRKTSLRVAQVGFSAKVHDFSSTNGFAYGILAIMIALTAGWGANAILRRD